MRKSTRCLWLNRSSDLQDLLDPPVEVSPVEGQIDDLLSEILKETEQGHKVLVTTLTKRMAEDLTRYMRENGI